MVFFSCISSINDVFVSNDYRVQNHNNGHSERIIPGKHETSKVSQKVASLLESYLFLSHLLLYKIFIVVSVPYLQK